MPLNSRFPHKPRGAPGACATPAADGLAVGRQMGDQHCGDRHRTTTDAQAPPASAAVRSEFGPLGRVLGFPLRCALSECSTRMSWGTNRVRSQVVSPVCGRWGWARVRLRRLGQEARPAPRSGDLESTNPAAGPRFDRDRHPEAQLLVNGRGCIRPWTGAPMERRIVTQSWPPRESARLSNGHRLDLSQRSLQMPRLHGFSLVWNSNGAHPSGHGATSGGGRRNRRTQQRDRSG